MKTSSFALLAIAGAATAAVYATDPCNMGTIQGSLLENGTTWHDSCTAATGVDVFLLNSFPTKAQAKNISQSRDCVNYINQLNQEANTDIQCETQVGDQTILFAELLTDLLTGQSSNKTKEVVAASSGSASLSGSVSLPESDSGSSSAAESAPASASSTSSATSESTSGSEEEESASASAEEQESSKSASAGSNAGVTVTATFSVVAAAATTVLAFAL